MRTQLLAFCIGVSLMACDHGLEPPPPRSDFGVVIATINYTSAWPDPADIRDLRLVMLPSIPRDTSDLFAQLDVMVFSDKLPYNVSADTVLLDRVINKVYLYTVVAQLYGPNAFRDWRPVGEYTATGGIIQMRGDTIRIHIDVDFVNPPLFPPE